MKAEETKHRRTHLSSPFPLPLGDFSQMKSKSFTNRHAHAYRRGGGGGKRNRVSDNWQGIFFSKGSISFHPPQRETSRSHRAHFSSRLKIMHILGGRGRGWENTAIFILYARYTRTDTGSGRGQRFATRSMDIFIHPFFFFFFFPPLKHWFLRTNLKKRSIRRGIEGGESRI